MCAPELGAKRAALTLEMSAYEALTRGKGACFVVFTARSGFERWLPPKNGEFRPKKGWGIPPQKWVKFLSELGMPGLSDFGQEPNC